MYFKVLLTNYFALVGFWGTIPLLRSHYLNSYTTVN